jgi:hypothetical protein
MKIFCLLSAITIATLLLFGCTTKAYLPTYSDSPKHGTITLFRVNEEPTAHPLNIYANDEKVATLRNLDTVTFSLPTGTHELSVDWPNTSTVFDDILSVNIKGQHQYFIAIIHCYGVSNYRRHVRREEWIMGELADAILLDEASAKKIISENILLSAIWVFV